MLSYWLIRVLATLCSLYMELQKEGTWRELPEFWNFQPLTHTLMAIASGSPTTLVRRDLRLRLPNEMVVSFAFSLQLQELTQPTPLLLH